MSELPASGDRPRHRLGVLLVHGIGTQPQRETLVRWGDALVELIAEATRPQKQAQKAEGQNAEEKAGEGEHDREDAAPKGEPANAEPTARPPLTVTLDGANPGTGTAEDPAEVAVVLETDDGRQERWLLTECWWADVFPPPTYGELVSWSVRAVPWSIALHVAQRFWQCSEDGWFLRAWASIRAVVQLLLALVLSPFIVLLLAVGLVLGLLPIPQLRSFILAAQSSLTATVGDSLAFVESPVRTALIHSRVRDSLAQLRARCCEHTIVVAHSQGAAVVHEALGGRDPSSGEGEGQLRPIALAPDTLVTFGAGINQLVALREVPGIIETIGKNPIAWAMRSLLLSAGLAALFYTSVRTGDISLGRVVGSALLVLVVVIILSIVVRWTLLVQGKSPRISAWMIVLVVVAVLLMAAFVAKRNELPFWPLVHLVLAVAALVLSFSMILGRNLEKILERGVRRPPGVKRWVDLYASADPVPNGSTRVSIPTEIDSVPIWNEGSILSDHTTYWSNRDEFVLRVAWECAVTAKSPWTKSLPRPQTPAAGERSHSERRVAYLWRAQALSRMAWLVAFVLVWSRAPELVPQPFELPAGLPAWVPTSLRFLVLAAVVALASAVTSALLRWPWRRWVRAEQKSFLTGRFPPTWDWLTAPLTWMAVVLALLSLFLQMLFEGLTGVGFLSTAIGGALSSPRQLSGSSILALSFLGFLLLVPYVVVLAGVLSSWDEVAKRVRTVVRKPEAG